MKKLMNLLMLACKKASELIDKKTIVKLTFKEKVMLPVHKGMCKACSAYQEQSKILDRLLNDYYREIPDADVHRVENKELKQQIISML